MNQFFFVKKQKEIHKKNNKRLDILIKLIIVNNKNKFIIHLLSFEKLYFCFN